MQITIELADEILAERIKRDLRESIVNSYGGSGVSDLLKETIRSQAKDFIKSDTFARMISEKLPVVVNEALTLQITRAVESLIKEEIKARKQEIKKRIAKSADQETRKGK